MYSDQNDFPTLHLSYFQPFMITSYVYATATGGLEIEAVRLL